MVYTNNGKRLAASHQESIGWGAEAVLAEDGLEDRQEEVGI